MSTVAVSGLRIAQCRTWGQFYRLLDEYGVAVDDYHRMLYEPSPIEDDNIPDMLRVFLITPYRWREDPVTDQLVIEQFYDPKEKSAAAREGRGDEFGWHSSEVQGRGSKGLLGGGRSGVLDYSPRPRRGRKSDEGYDFGW